jgi:hypothetical protein
MATTKKTDNPEPPAAAEVLSFPNEDERAAKELSRTQRFDDADLRAITTFEEAFALAEMAFGEITDITQELGNGFTLITDKSVLVNKPFVIVSCAFNDGDFGQFASIAAVTRDNQKYIFNDGSTGVHNQLFELARTKKRTGGFFAPSGLSQSDYDTCANKDCLRARPNAVKECAHCGDTSEARKTGTTYFLNLAPAASS